MEKYFIHCLICKQTEKLQMFAHRIDNKIVGWVFSCPNCAERVADGDLYFTDTSEKKDKRGRVQRWDYSMAKDEGSPLR